MPGGHVVLCVIFFDILETSDKGTHIVFMGGFEVRPPIITQPFISPEVQVLVNLVSLMHMQYLPRFLHNLSQYARFPIFVGTDVLGVDAANNGKR